MKLKEKNLNYLIMADFCRKKGSLIFSNFETPIYKFRPSQADPMHLDLWIDGLNLLKDGGTLSYNKKVNI